MYVLQIKDVRLTSKRPMSYILDAIASAPEMVLSWVPACPSKCSRLPSHRIGIVQSWWNDCI